MDNTENVLISWKFIHVDIMLIWWGNDNAKYEGTRNVFIRHRCPNPCHKIWEYEAGQATEESSPA